MNGTPTTHPAPALLQAFGLGLLDEATTEEVSRHLESCPECRRRVAELPDDSLLEHLRQANNLAATPAPAQALSSLTQAMAVQPPALSPMADDLPPELRHNAQYDILRRLGAGGMGVVYLARNRWLGRLEVLKVIGSALVDKAEMRERFLREIRAAGQLSHDHVVKAHSVAQCGELLVFAMEYVEGEDLAQVVKTQGPLPVASACHYVRQVALGLQHAHDRGMVHRDIKPSNLIVARAADRPMVKILDFGLAKASSEKGLQRDLTGAGKMLGTPDYMAPEQIVDAASADIRADIYSLGCTLYHLLTGAPPFHADSVFLLLQAHHTSDARPVHLVRPEAPAALAAVVARMMAKNPAERYPRPVDVAQALTPFVGEAACADARFPQRARKPSLWVALLLSAVLVGLALWGAAGSNRIKTNARAPAGPLDVDGLPPTFTNRLDMDFVLVGKGTALLGGGGNDQGDRKVEIAYDFYLGKYEVTQEQWHTVTGLNPSAFSRAGGSKERVQDIPEADLKRFPVEWVSWDDAQAFLVRLNAQAQKAGWVYRLPTAVEWEYACRGGPRADRFDSAFDFYFDKPANQLLPAQANFGQGLKRTCKVGSYAPNRLGLYDMHGNVAEWCGDVHRTREGVVQRVVRGGAWDDPADVCRASIGGADPPDWRREWTGLRVALVRAGKENKPER